MAPRTKRKVYRRPKALRKRKHPLSSASANSTSKSPVPESNDPLEENISEGAPVPDGYTFVPKGDIYVTRHCRSKTKESHQPVYVTYNRTGRRVLGISVPEEIYMDVVALADVTCKARAKAVQARDAKYLSHSEELLRAQFPLMPDESVKVVLEHSFLKGSGRVGRATTTTDKRKAHLAVEAHIRHVHTPYESLLDGGKERKNAREIVWPSVQAIKKAWEGTGEWEVVDLACSPA